MNTQIINKNIMKKSKELKASAKTNRKLYKNYKAIELKARMDKVFTFNGLCEKDIPTKASETIDEEVMEAIESTETLEYKVANNFISIIEGSKLTGMSGNGFPVYKKLRAINSFEGPKKTFIINAVECEPGLIHDQWIFNTHLKEVAEGIRIIKAALKLDNATIAVKATKEHKAGTVVACEGYDICYVPYKYPMGEEHFLIKEVMGDTIAMEDIPVNKGILVMNIQTVYQIACIIAGKYQGGRYITVANFATGIAKAVYYHEGKKATEILDSAFGIAPEGCVVYVGKGIMGSHPLEDDIVNIDEDFVAYYPKEYANIISNSNKCKGCGACSKNCPAGIDVRKIVRLREKDETADISMFNPERCIKCGSCVWFCCASKRPGYYVNC